MCCIYRYALEERPPDPKCYAMRCFGTYFTHAQTCDNVRVQSATQCAASVHTLHMPKPVITVAFKVQCNALLRCILYTFWMAARKRLSRYHCVLLHSFQRLNARIKKTGSFFFIGILPCYVFIGFCNRFSHGGEVMWGW